MNNKFIHSVDPRRYTEVIKPLADPLPGIPLALSNIGYSKIYQPYLSPLFDYQGFVLMYTVSGKGMIKIENDELLLNQGDLICYRQTGYRVRLTPLEGDWEYRWLDLYGENTAFYYHEINPGGTVAPVPYPLEAFEYHMGKVYNCLIKRDQSAVYEICDHSTRLLTDVIMQKRRHQTALISGKYQENLSRVFEYMDEHFADPVTVEQLAGLFLSSKYHFIRVFKEYTGMTPINYLTKLRIYKSIDYMADGSLSIEDIAYRIGYKTPSQYIAKFKEIIGTTPNKYKNNKISTPAGREH